MFYETQIAAPRADAITKKNPTDIKQAPQIKPETKINTQTIAAVTPPFQPLDTQQTTSRIIDLNTPDETVKQNKKEQEALLKSLDESVKKTIQRSISLDIQKAVATELSKQAH